MVVKFVEDHPNRRLLLLVDENLELDHASVHEIVSGSRCVKQVRNILKPKEEQRILAVVRSANDSPSDVGLYTSRAHAYMPKVPLRAAGVREHFAPLWEARFAGPDGDADSDTEVLPTVASIEDLRDLLLISPAELMSELEAIDSICMSGEGSVNWPKLWEQLHKLKGDLMVVSIPGSKSPGSTIGLIEALRGDKMPTDFTGKWLAIRSSAISLIIDN